MSAGPTTVTDMPLRSILRSRTLWSAAALFALYWLAAHLIPNGPLMEGLHTVRIAICLVVVVAYAPVCLEALAGGRIGRVEQLSLGITIGWGATLLAGVWSLLWRLAGQPAWMVNSDLNGFFLWVTILGAVLHVTAPGAVDGTVPRRTWILTGLAFGAGALAAAALLARRPDMAAIMDGLAPWIRE